MANENDGSIIIDTELDNTGFQKGSEKLTKAIEEAARAFDNFGDNMMNSFNRVIPLLQSIAGSASQINAAINGTATQTEDASARVVDSEQRVRQAAEEATAAVNNQGAAAGSFNSNINSTKNAVSALEREVNSLSSGLQSVSNSAEMGFANGKAVLAFDAKLQALEQRLTAARKRLAEFGNTQIPTEDYTSLVQQIEKAEQALLKLYNRRDDLQALGVKENSAQWQRLALQIENAEAELARYERERDTLAANGGAFVNGAQTAEYAQMQDALNNAGASLNRNRSLIDQEALAQARLNVLAAQEEVTAARTTREREAALERLRAAQEALNDVASSMSNNPGGEEPTEESVSGWQRFGEAIKSASAGALNLTGNLAKLPLLAAAKGAQKLGFNLKGFGKIAASAKNQANSLVKSLTSLKRMLITRVKRMFISEIFNQAKEGIQTLARFSDAFNQSMSNIKNRSKEASGNLAISLGSLVTTLEPIISGVMDAVSKLFTYINGVFSLISGKSTMTIAKKQTDSYRDSLNGAAKSAEELKNQVYGFDELNKRSDTNNTSGVTDGSDLFEEIEVDSVLPESLRSFIEDLKELWEESNFFDFGGRLAEGLNGIVETVDSWFDGTLGTKLREWATNIADGINGFVDGFEWGRFGEMLTSGISDVLIGIYDFTSGFLEKIDWSTLAQSLWDGLAGMIAGIKWGELVGSMFEYLGAALGAATSFVSTIAENIWKTLKDAWESVRTYFSEYIDGFGGDIIAGLWEGIKNALKDVGKWIKDNIFQPFIDGFNRVFEIGSPSKVMERQGHYIVEGLLNGITDKWESIKTFFSTTLSELKKTLSEKWDEIKKNASDKWETIKTTVTDKLDDAKTTLSKTAENIKTTLSTVWQDIKTDTTTAWENIKTTLSTTWETVKTNATTAWEGIKSTISDKFDNAKASLSKTAESIKTTTSTAWESMKSKATSIWESIKSTVTQKFDNTGSTLAKTAESIGATTSSIWDNLKSNSSASWDNIKTSVTSAFGTLPGSVTVTANNIKSAISTAWGNIQSATTTAWNSLKSSIMSLWNGIKSSLQSTTSSWSSVGTNLVNGLRSGISSAWSSLTSTVSSLANTLTSTLQRAFSIHSPSKVWAEIGEYLDLGLVRGIEDEQGTILKTVSNLAKNVSDKFDTSEATLQVGTDCADMVSRLGTLSDKLSDIATAFWSISDRLSSIGNLKIPAIAAGTVVPYKTRIAENSASDLFGGQFETFSRDLDERMYDQVSMLRRILELLERAKLGVDNDELAQAIALAMRGATRGFGGA